MIKLDVYLTTPSVAVSPWLLKSYALNVETIKFNLSSEINFHPIIDKEKLLFDQRKHPVTEISLSGIITADSDLPGTTIYDMRDNLIAAVVKWNIAADIKTKTNCPQLVYRGNTFYVVIDRIETTRSPGSDEIPYIMNLIENKGD